jgi:hypothetical protein
MAVDPNGYCTQCGTFRGQVTQPVSGAPYPPQGGGYQYQPPASGPPWPAQTSASPYPFSGPPVSGPGYPQSAPPQSAPPANRRSLFGVLIAASAVLVILVGAIVVLAIVRSGKHPDPVATGTPTAGPASTAAASAAIDPCLVGTWKATSEHQKQDFPSIGQITLTGQGEVSHVRADGTVDDDYSQATPYTGSYNGHSITMTVTGTVHSRITTSAGTLAFHDVVANGSVTLKVDGTTTGSPYPLSMSNDPVQYTCTGKTATEHTEHYDVTLEKISDQP